MKNIWKVIIATILVVAGATNIASHSAYADDEAESEPEKPRTEISISPTMATISLEGGDVIEGDSPKCPQDPDEGCVVIVKNTGSTSYKFRVHITPYTVSGSNNTVSFDESSSNSYSQITRWITFRQDNGSYSKEYTGELAPGESRSVYYKIDVPDDIPGGSQYAAIWAQTINTTGATVGTVGEAGMTIRGRAIGNTNRAGEVTDFGFQRFSVGGGLEAHAAVKNTGNTDYEAHYEYTASTFFGKELYSDSDAIAAWPDSEYDINVKWEDTPFLGIFNVRFRVDAADSVVDQISVVVIMPVIIMILLISLLTVIIIWIIIIIRKRKERKARKLV